MSRREKPTVPQTALDVHDRYARVAVGELQTDLERLLFREYASWRTGHRVLVEVRASGQMRRVTKISNPLL
jgi:hypothetical protein